MDDHSVDPALEYGIGRGPSIRYVKVQSYNPYTAEPLTVILAKDLLHNYFPKKNEELPMEGYDGKRKEHSVSCRGEYTERI